MQDLPTIEHQHPTVNWYVSRRVDVLAANISALTLPTVTTASGGTTLTILGPVFVDDSAYRSFGAVLSCPGVLPGKVKVELDLNPYSSRLVEIGLRPARRAPGLLVSAERYFDSAWSALDSLADALAAVAKASEHRAA